MQREERFRHILAYFRRHDPEPETELQYGNPFELLVSVILSAQCTDKRVNLTTPELFKKFPDAYSLSHAKYEEVRRIIRSITFPNNKTKHLIGMAKILTKQYGGKIPDDIKELQTLPGVGRKTAHVIASVVFRKPALAVDTHVFRVANRTGLARAKTPLHTELQLVRYIPPDQIPMAHHWLILHGRYVCKARKPLCPQCAIRRWCKYAERNGISS